MGGAGSYSLVAQHLSGWFRDQRRWVDALVKAWLADPEVGAANAAHLGAAVESALATAGEAVRPLAVRADELVDGGCVAALESALTSTRAAFVAAGATLKEA